MDGLRPYVLDFQVSISPGPGSEEGISNTSQPVFLFSIITVEIQAMARLGGVHFGIWIYMGKLSRKVKLRKHHFSVAGRNSN